MPILAIILSILLPPLAVALTRGMSPALLVNIILTLMGWLPGCIHALYINSNSYR